MQDGKLFLKTDRLHLRSWREEDLHPFAAMNAHPEVMLDYGGPLSRADSDAKLKRYAAAFEEHGFGRWLVETPGGDFMGYCGVMSAIGWRLVRHAWGHGFATEAARTALEDVFDRIGLDEVLAYTAPDNVRSQAVMRKLDLERDPARDFVAIYDATGQWRGLVWVARPG